MLRYIKHFITAWIIVCVIHSYYLKSSQDKYINLNQNKSQNQAKFLSQSNIKNDDPHLRQLINGNKKSLFSEEYVVSSLEVSFNPPQATL